MFDIIPMNIIILIKNWIVSSEYKDKHIKIITRFTRQPFLVICKFAHKHQKPCHNYGTLQVYRTVRYEWARRIDNTHPLRLYMKPVLKKLKLLNMLISYTY